MQNNEKINTNPNMQLPTLEGLSDAEYLAQSQKFGREWQAFVDGTQDGVEGMEGVSQELAERSAALAAIPEEERAATLIESYREAANARLVEYGQQPLQTEPLTPELIEAAGAQVVEVRTGVPAVLTNGRHNDALFGSKSGNFATGVLNDVEGALPFVVLHNTRDSKPEWFETNRRHETAHTLWAIAQKQAGAEAPATDQEAAFERIQDEGIAFATAGQGQLLHTGNVQDMRRANMGNAVDQYYDMAETYSALTTAALEPQAVVLGMMHAQDLDGLSTHMNRLYTASEHLRPPEAPAPPPTLIAVGGTAVRGWGAS